MMPAEFSGAAIAMPRAAAESGAAAPDPGRR
jgi:hypothetical protein